MKEKLLKSWQMRIFILCWIAYAFVYFGRVNISVAIPEIQNEFGWDKWQVGLIGSLFFWIYGIGQLINGNIGDRISSRVLIFVGLFVTALANLFFGLSASFPVMIILWSLNGYFQSTLWGPITKTLSFWFSHESRGKVAIWISTSMVGGYLLAWGLSGQILALFTWRWAFCIPGAAILVYSAIWYLKMKNHPMEVGLESPNKYVNTKPDSDTSTYSGLSFFQVFLKTKLWYVVIACLTQGIIKDGISLWGPTLLKETHNLDMESTSALIVFIPLMNFAGIMMAGWLNKRLGNKEKLATAVLFASGMFSILLLVYLGKLSPVAGLIFLGLSSAAMYGANTLLLGVIPMNFAKYNKVSSIAGFLDFCSYLAAGCTASITGLIVDKLGWNGVLSVWIVSCVIGVVSLMSSWKSEEKPGSPTQLSALS